MVRTALQVAPRLLQSKRIKERINSMHIFNILPLPPLFHVLFETCGHMLCGYFTGLEPDTGFSPQHFCRSGGKHVTVCHLTPHQLYELLYREHCVNGCVCTPRHMVRSSRCDVIWYGQNVVHPVPPYLFLTGN